VVNVEEIQPQLVYQGNRKHRILSLLLMGRRRGDAKEEGREGKVEGST